MIIELRRYGIVIKSTPITGDKASFGSGADCSIMIEDPYLAAHVGDFVRRGENWFIVDAGTSLDGITRDGERIDDEAVVHGRVYSIGGFELVAPLPAASAARPASSAPSQGQQPIPGTVVESIDNLRKPKAAIPETVLEPLPVMPRKAEIPETVLEPLPRRQPEAEVPSTVFDAPMPSRRAPAAPASQPVAPTPAAAAPRASSSRRLILLIAVFAMGFLLLLLLLFKRSDKKEPAIIATQTTPPVASTTVAPPPPPRPVVTPATPAEMLGSLKYDGALDAWERQLAKADDPGLRARYAALALEIGRIHAANRSPDATAYFERAVKFGPAGDQAVAEAKRRLGNE